jgi:magnesium and cobalt transporter
MNDGDPGEGSSSKSWIERVADIFSGEPSNRVELMEVIRDAEERQLLDAEAMNIIFGALQVSEMQAREVMIPRSQMIYVRASSPPEDFLSTIIDSQHSRFPVVGEELDDVKGILHAKDLLPLLVKGEFGDFDIKDYIRQAPVIPESKRLNVLLQEFRQNRNHMAVVVDEYGHVAGVVTIEDVLEQIVGEIEDEHDVRDDSFIKQLDEHTYTVKAVTSVEDFNEHFDAKFSHEEFDTIGGVVMHGFGHLPKREETINIDRFCFKVLNADSRRIRLLHMTTTPVAGASAD